MEVHCVYCSALHPVPDGPWDQIGSDEFCPKGATLEYDETYIEELDDVAEHWYFEKRGDLVR